VSVSRSTAPMCSLGARERCCGGLSAAPARCSSPISKETYGGARMASTPSGSTPTPSRQGTTGAPRLKAAVASPATRWISMVPSGAVSLGSPTTCIAPFARVSTSADSSVSLNLPAFCRKRSRDLTHHDPRGVASIGQVIAVCRKTLISRLISKSTPRKRVASKT